MRNTTMRDKLETILSSGVSTEIKVESDNHVVWGGKVARQKAAKEVKKKSAPAFIAPSVSQNPFKDVALVGPRYIVPPKRKNPFAVHVYPVVTSEEPNLETQPEEIKTVLLESESAVVLEPISVPEPVPTPAPKVFVVPDHTSHKPAAPKVINQAPEKVVRQEEIAIAEAIVAEAIVAEAVVEETAVEETAVEEAVVEELAEEELVVEEPVATLLEMPALESISEEKKGIIYEDAPPTISLPPNLTWLDQSTPFGGELTQMVDKLRSAKTNVGFMLEQSIRRQKDLRGQLAGLQERLDKEEYFGEQQKDSLKQLDEVIAACALVAEQSAPIESILQQMTNAVHKKHPEKEKRGSRRPYKMSADDKTVCHSVDVVEFFKTHPGRNWSVQEIICELPAMKRDSAKQNLYAHLSYMVQKGTLQRIGSGVYRALES